MKRIYCELHLFDLNQTVYIVDSSNGFKEAVAATTLEALPEVISAICNDQKIYKVTLSGNDIFGDVLATDILSYSKKHYNFNEIEVEVLK